MHRRIIVAGLLIVTVALMTGCGEPIRKERAWTVMGTFASATVYHRTEDGAVELLEDIRTAYESVDASMSNWEPESELGRLNRQAAVEPSPVEDAELYRCIKIALEYAKSTGGAFDPTVGPLVTLWGFRGGDPRVPEPDEITESLRHVGWEKVELIKVARAVRFRDPGVELDLGGLAKGYALDVAARSFAKSGSVAGLMDLGRGIYAWGSPPDSEAWRVAIQDPEDPDGVMATIDLANRAIATSGDYENAFVHEGRRYGHILDPSTGRPAESDVISATVVADAGVDADALSTAMFVAGSGLAAEFLRHTRRVEAVLVVKTRTGIDVLASGSLKGSLHLDPTFQKRTGARARYLLPPLSIQNQGILTRFGGED